MTNVVIFAVLRTSSAGKCMRGRQDFFVFRFLILDWLRKWREFFNQSQSVGGKNPVPSCKQHNSLIFTKSSNLFYFIICFFGGEGVGGLEK